ncbi:hypothetical protein B0H14DRAFT_2986451 [Mycena olivaceomarginata]|nr:hypothetical protein B0H14DRAFT_2986451 [Mycena olivaceomarginata]
MAVCAGSVGGAVPVSRVCRWTSPEDGRTARVGHGGDVAGRHHSPLALGMTLGVRIVIYGARRRRGLRSTSTESVERKDYKVETRGVIHASPLVAPVLLADLLRLRACQRASSWFHVGTRTEGMEDYEKRLPAAVVDDDLMDMRKIQRHLRPWKSDGEYIRRRG